ncbi:MAG TPA: aminotransferase class V-fold PLP-dependent enzyme [Gemmataceae bacterium]|nr:aminotransferase class V-fold PLP-dependent enzyme [Gemmataceae bacterium]
MLRVGQYVFKRAETNQEFEQIHRLNHRTFVGEIPQHPDTGNGLLIDKFHKKNAYLIVLRESRVVGMVSAHDQPPFSVAERLREPGILQRTGTRPLEVRLLAIEPEERNSTMFFGLIWSLYEYARSHGYTHLYISGVEERLALYQRLGFVALGPAVASGKASFVPMVLTIGQLPVKMQRVKQLWEIHMDKVTPRRAEPVCLLPGPVTTAEAVRAAFHQPPIYHRGPEFIRRFMKVRTLLGKIVGGRDVALLNGSGTLGNEAVAAALASSPRKGRGLMLINGEFGERLARQATRFGLEPRILSWPWGEPWDLDEVEAALAQEPAGSWVWGVHQDSSTGVLNDLPGLVKLARARDIRVCVDCISSLGAVPLDLRDVYLATGATGKSLGAIAGTAIIFADLEALQHLDRSRVPSYFDIAAAMRSEGPCYTFPSPTLLALETALQEYATPEKAQASYDRYQEMGLAVREQLRRLGLPPLAREDCACPVVTTFAPPGEESSEEFVHRCRGWGFAIGGESAYLAQRRLVQIATMGAITRDMFASLFDHLETWLARSPLVAETV